MSPERTFVGFGFGPIQLGLFLAEAFASGAFGRLVVAYRRAPVIAAVRRAGGMVQLNVAHRDRLELRRFGPIEIRDLNEPADRAALVAAIAEAHELATALSSVRDYASAGPGSVHRLLAAGLARKLERDGPRAVIYAAENHRRAAALLMGAVRAALPAALRERLAGRVQALDTVIGKMSGLAAADARLAPIAPGLERAALVEAFNRILISRVRLEGFARGLAIFEERSELGPFEEAKLYGHNAAHALLAYLGRAAGLHLIREAEALPELLALARDALLEESGAALLRRYRGTDPLFSAAGFRRYADDLLERMMNPFLNDTVDRVGRDAARKLGWNDRLVGTMRLVLEQGLTPRRYALAAAAALAGLPGGADPRGSLPGLWADAAPPPEERERVLALIAAALPELERWRARAG